MRARGAPEGLGAGRFVSHPSRLKEPSAGTEGMTFVGESFISFALTGGTAIPACELEVQLYPQAPQGNLEQLGCLGAVAITKRDHFKNVLALYVCQTLFRADRGHTVPPLTMRAFPPS